MFVGFHGTDQVFRDTFVKLNFGSPHNKNNNLHKNQHSSCDDLLLNSRRTPTTTGTTADIERNNNISDNEILESKKRLRKFRRKQDRKRSSHEDVEVRSYSTEKDENNNSNNNSDNAKLMSKDPAMSPVNLIGFKTNGHHYQEPHYEAIKDLSLKAAFRINGSNSNSSTPEGSPKLHHHRKYILNSDALLAEKISPMLERKKKLSAGKSKNPPLPKRNSSSSSQFYIESAANNAIVNANPIYGNTALIMNASPRSSGSSDTTEPCYTDVAFQKNIKNSKTTSATTTHKKQQPQVDHPYSEITPRPRRSERMSDVNNFYNDSSPISSPIHAMPSPFSSHRFFRNSKSSNVAVVDGSKSDGDLSDSDVLDVPRLYDRRRSRTGNGEELADPSRFYVTIPEKPPRRAVKQNYHGNAYEKDYVETTIRPRPSTTVVSSEISSSRSSSVKSLTYENGLLYRSSSEDDETNDEPTYENPDLQRVPTYENNELLHDDVPQGYATVRQTSVSNSSSDAPADSNYNNIVFPNRNEQLQYASVADVHNRHLYDNVSCPDPDSGLHKSRMYSVTKNSKYTEIDFTKSDGLREALNQLRAGDNSVAPELDAEYKIDLSHIKFTRSSDSKRNSKNFE